MSRLGNLFATDSYRRLRKGMTRLFGARGANTRANCAITYVTSVRYYNNRMYDTGETGELEI